MVAEPTLTVERLREILNYNPETGALTWRIRAGQRCHVDAVVGTRTDQGYRRVKINGHSYLAHVLAWVYV